MAELTIYGQRVKNALTKKGFDPGLCDMIASQMNTEWTSMRILGYLREVPNLRDVDVVDEMLAILSDRDRIRQKKESEYYQSKINEIYEYGLLNGDE